MEKNEKDINKINALMREYGINPYSPGAYEELLDRVRKSQMTKKEIIKEKIEEKFSGFLGCLLPVIIFIGIGAVLVFMIGAVKNEWIIGYIFWLLLSIVGLVFTVKWIKESRGKQRFYAIFSLIGCVIMIICAIALIISKSGVI